jgi:hypothetical protein
MSENTNNEDESVIAMFVENEAAISAEYAEEDKAAIDDLVVKYEKAVDAEEEALESSTITSPEPVEEKPALGFVKNGVMGSTTIPKDSAKKAPAVSNKPAKKDTVAVHSTRNVTWNGVGKVYIGYNIVSKEAAEQWLKRDHIRLATPEEVAMEYGK